MARPVKETPVLEGRDAERFEAAIKRNRTDKVPKAQYDRAIQIYERITRASTQ